MDIYHLIANNYSIRTEELEGKKHLVVPVVMMVEGVHSGSAGPVLHLSEDLGMHVESWNGIPVTVPHPEENGSFVSANSPDAINTFKVGQVFNTRFENGKLKAEVWLDEEKLRQYSLEALGYIRQGRPLDVSVGVFTDDEPTSGEWNGETYNVVARNHRPDHLALLPGTQGACSWTDGCGIRTNEKGGEGVIEKELAKSIKSLVGKGYQVCLKTNEQGFNDTMRQIQTKLDGMDDDVKLHWLVETFDDFFVYEVGRFDSGETALYKRSYSVNEEDVIEFTGEPEQVVRTVEFKTLQEGGETPMAEKPCCEAKVVMVLEMEHLPFAETDRDYLMTLKEDRLDELLAIKAPEAAPFVEDGVNSPAQVNEAQVKSYIDAQFADVDKVMAILPGEMKEQLQSGLKLHRAKRDSLVAHITANSDVYSKEELEAMDMDALEKLGKITKAPADYSLVGDPPEINNSQSQEKLLPPGVKPKKAA